MACPSKRWRHIDQLGLPERSSGSSRSGPGGASFAPIGEAPDGALPKKAGGRGEGRFTLILRNQDRLSRAKNRLFRRVNPISTTDHIPSTACGAASHLGKCAYLLRL